MTALLLGGISTLVTVSVVTDGSLNQTTQEPVDGDMSQEEYEAMLDDITEAVSLPKVVQAFNIIQENYIEDIEQEALIEGAVRGMLNTLGDPYSEYMDEDTMAQFDEQIESSFEGIGAEVSMVDGKVTIISPIQDSPAESVGLRPNDQVITIDGESIEGLDLTEAVSKIRGEKGTEVVIEIERAGVSDLLEFEITRDTIPLETVYAETEEVNGQTVGMIQITSFAEQTGSRFQEELESLESDDIDGLIIDVRNNPGGLLPVIEDILKLFITSDQPYMQIEDGEGNAEPYYSDLEEEKDYPVSVLIDEGSASASEILAIALNEAIDAEIVGKNSFGKGTVQQTVPMGDGSSIKITILDWLSPEGNSIHEVGVEPTIEVDQPDYYYVNPIQLEETLSFDDNNEQIEFAQIMLDGLGYSVDRQDGYFDGSTVEALEAFQSENEIDVTGELNQDTAEVLQTQIIEQMQANQDDLQREAAKESLFD